MKKAHTKKHWLSPRVQSRRRVVPGVLLVIVILLALTLIYSNDIYRVLGKTPVYEYSTTSGEFRFDLGKEREHKMLDGVTYKLRDLKVSYPISASGGGCELLYGAAVFDHDPEVPAPPAHSWQYAFAKPRYLLKFKYDLKNKRCESKDLFLLSKDLPRGFVLQFVQVELHPDKVVETPLSEGVEVRILKEANSPTIVASSVTVPPGDPFISAQTTRRVKSFSVPHPQGVSLLIHPYEPLNEFVALEIRARIDKCKKTGVCDAIRAAVAKISDVPLLELFEEAREAGLPVELITNYRFRFDREADEIPGPGKLLTHSPWFWLRGSPFSKKASLYFPMHTKIVVFGDDMVVSSNPSLRGGYRHRSREYSLVYRDPAVTAIFKEIFTLVRTSLYYPLRIDLNDELLVLFNADRPRQYSVSSEKPYVAIDTNEGVRSNAYGVLYEILARSAGPMSLVMSPITDSCAPYRVQRCLFDELRRFAQAGKLDLVLNAYYYLPDEQRGFMPSFEPNWTPATLNAALQPSRQYQELKSLYPDGETGPRVFVQRDRGSSTHHERAALLGGDTSILGSSNWAVPTTINTIEVLRSREVATRLRSELATFNEPWFVAKRDPRFESETAYGVCDFVFEISTSPTLQISRPVDLAVILDTLKARYNLFALDRPMILLPTREADDLESKVPVERFDPKNDVVPHEVFSGSSYLCLADGNRAAAHVVRIPCTDSK